MICAWREKVRPGAGGGSGGRVAAPRTRMDAMYLACIDCTAVRCTSLFMEWYYFITLGGARGGLMIARGTIVNGTKYCQ